MKIDAKKIGLIHVAKSRLGLCEDDYRMILRSSGKVNSARDLDLSGFEAVMRQFNRLGFLSTRARTNFGSRPGMATGAQVALIRKLWAEFTAGEASDKDLGKWLSKTFQVSSVRFVSDDVAPKVIGALKAMVGRRHHSAA